MNPPIVSALTENTEHTVFANGAKIPAIGFGAYGMGRPEMLRTIPAALKEGFRHIDTAQIYRNEAEVGECIVSSGNPALGNIRHHESVGRELSGEQVCRVRRRKPREAAERLYRSPAVALAQRERTSGRADRPSQ